MDALSWYEFQHTFHYVIPGLYRPPPPAPDDSVLRPQAPIISSPNMMSIPRFGRADRDIWIRENGRFYYHDFSLAPQFYYDETTYMPYILVKPPAEELAQHQYRVIWYDLQPSDFLPDPDATEPGMGFIRDDLGQECNDLRKALQQRVKDFVASGTIAGDQTRELQHSMTAAHFASLCLIVAPQNWLGTLLTFTLFQRNFLEVLAHIERFTKFLDREMNMPATPYPVDTSYMGAITTDPMVAERLFFLGVPIWFLRHPSQLSNRHTYCHRVEPEDMSDCLIERRFPGSHKIYEGDISPFRNRVCQLLRVSNVRIGHAAFGIALGNAGDGKEFVNGFRCRFIDNFDSQSTKSTCGIVEFGPELWWSAW